MHTHTHTHGRHKRRTQGGLEARPKWTRGEHKGGQKAVWRADTWRTSSGGAARAHRGQPFFLKREPHSKLFGEPYKIKPLGTLGSFKLRDETDRLSGASATSAFDLEALGLKPKKLLLAKKQMNEVSNPHLAAHVLAPSAQKTQAPSLSAQNGIS